MLNFNFDGTSPAPNLKFRFGDGGFINFNFDGTSPAPSLAFEFGEVPTLITGAIAASSMLRMVCNGREGAQGKLASTSEVPSASFLGEYDEKRTQELLSPVNASFSQAKESRTKVCLDWEPHCSIRKNVNTPLVDAKRVHTKVCAVIDGFRSTRLFYDCVHTEGTIARFWTTANSASGTPFRENIPLYWGKATAAQMYLQLDYVSAWPRRSILRHTYSNALPVSKYYCEPFNDAATRILSGTCNSWEEAQLPPFIWPIPIPPVPPQPDDRFYGDTNLNLKCALPAWSPICFNIGATNVCDQAYWLFVVPKVVIVTHDLWVKLISDDTIIPCLSVSLSLDRDSWGWGWTAQLNTQRSDLINTQQTVEINIDGHRWKGIVEQYSGSRQFGQTAYSIGGRSLAAELTSPYTAPRSRNETSARTFKQLIEDELYLTGWTVDWSPLITDWTIPGGLFSYSDKTPMSAIIQIAQAIGCTVQADPSLKVLHISPKYKCTPWAIASASPDALIPLGVIVNEGITWEPRTLMKGVWVSGTTHGQRVNVYRDGTDGAPYAPMVVDPLITEVAAGIQRGTQELSATGRRRNIDLTFPLIPEIGVVPPGYVVEVSDTNTWRGFVDSVKIDANLQSGVSQAVSIEHIQEF